MYGTVQSEPAGERDHHPERGFPPGLPAEAISNSRGVHRAAAFTGRGFEISRELDVNRDRLQGKWKQLSGSVRERWGRLTGDWLSVVAGRHDQLAGKHQEQYGVHREEGERQLRDFLRRHRNWNSTTQDGK